MKATLDRKGTLTVQAENELEAYALRHWTDNFKDEGTSVLFVLPDPDAKQPTPQGDHRE